MLVRTNIFVADIECKKGYKAFFLCYNILKNTIWSTKKGEIDLYNSSGLEFLDFIEKEKSAGKTLDDIAKENGKTKEAIRSKIKRERKKISSTEIEVGSKEIKESIKEKHNKIIEKSIIKKNDINTQEINNKLEFIINLLQNSKQREEDIQSVGQALQIDVQCKNTYIKTSIRVDSTVWEEFKDFANNNRNLFKQQDLVTAALREFLEKYK